MNKLTILEVAELCHLVNMNYCETQGDFSQGPWELCPPWQRDSAIHGVTEVIKNPEITPEQSHQNWLDERIENGWTYGPEKDYDRLTHPCILPYDQLPLEERVKDRLFIGIILALLPVIEVG